MPMIDCRGYGAGVYSPPIYAPPVINQSQVSPAVRRGAYSNSADIDIPSERPRRSSLNITVSSLVAFVIATADSHAIAAAAPESSSKNLACLSLRNRRLLDC